MRPVEVARTEDAKARFAKVKQVHLHARGALLIEDERTPALCVVGADEASRTPRDAMLQFGGVRLSLVVTVGSFAVGASFLALEARRTDAPSTDAATNEWRPTVNVADFPALSALRVSVTVVGVERAPPMPTEGAPDPLHCDPSLRRGDAIPPPAPTRAVSVTDVVCTGEI